MQKLVTVLCVVLSAGVCIAAQDGNSVVEEVAGEKSVTKSVVVSKAIGVEQIRAIDHVGSDRYALVIGINDYQDGLVPDLKTCEADAEAIYALLTDPTKGGIDKKNAYLLLGSEATARNIGIHLGKLRRIPSKSTVFVYFSGHGSKEGDEAYWVAQDSRMEDLFATGISNMEVQRYLSSIPSDRVVVMLDCCYAAATVKGGKASVGDFADVLNKFTGKGRAYLMAAGSGEEAIEAKDLKRSVFTHYLVEGLDGRADDNKDGVIVLTELSTYVDSHVADEARVRGGLQRPVVRMDNVTEPSKFRLTIDAERIARNICETAETKALRNARLKKLRELYLDKKLGLDLYQLCIQLLEKDEMHLDNMEKKKYAEIVEVADGTLTPDKLQLILDAIETPAQRTIRLERETNERPARIKQAKIEELLSIAQSNDNKTDGKQALEALKELLQLDTSHPEALSLQKKISGYYEPNPGDVITNSIEMKLVYIPAGEFIMGSPSNEERRSKNEGPQHSVKISKGFWMGQTEVTQAQWQSVMGTSIDQQAVTKDYRSSGDYGEGPDYPIYHVSWEEAGEFCRRLSQKEGQAYRLPTEAEWEYACRAGTTTAYSFGDKITLDKANFRQVSGWSNEGREQAIEVGSFQPNAFGLYDMHGNMGEWCQDRYDKNYYSKSPSIDPTGPSSGKYYVVRGGAWGSYYQQCRSAVRCSPTPSYRVPSSGLGFRVVLLPD